jgi:hypothetical protein
MNAYYNFIQHNFCKTLLLLLFVSFAGSMQAQEFLTGLKSNTQIIKEAQKQKELLFNGKSQPENTPLLLPFFEDFSNYIGYPNENLFIDKQAFVNNTFPVFAPTIGVVTLDALNEFGEIYPHLNTSSKGADTLTSRFIRLDSLLVEGAFREITLADSLYFSFYFQPGGGGVAGAGPWEYIGNQPDANDSLVLEFGYYPKGDTVTRWDHIWSTPGFNLNKWTSENPLQYFKQVMIPITNEKYLCGNFQFRFRNYASLEPQQGILGWEGNVDQWHIDYIRLDVKRNHNDIFTNDLAFVSPTTSFLKNCQSMPWKQFQPADMKSNFTNQLSNLFGGTLSSTYEYTITYKGNVVHSYESGAYNTPPYFSDGVVTQPRQASPAISPYSPPYLTDTATFKITHIFQNSSGVDHDFCLANDTCVFEQKFYDYYAYDDGTAEYGYCINNQFNIAYLAMKFPLRVSDELSAVRMWFNHTRNSENEGAQFNIVVWKDDNGQPGDTLYTSTVKQPRFAEQFLDFVEYQFDKKVPVSGNIWVGFQQQGNVQLNIGFDQNTDSREFFKFNTQGKWETSVFRGTPMLRPVFGEIDPLSICCAPPVAAKLRPNPAKDWVEITNYELRIMNVEVFDMMGRGQKAEGRRPKAENVLEVNVSHLPAGIYFVRIYYEDNSFETVKLIKN